MYSTLVSTPLSELRVYDLEQDWQDQMPGICKEVDGLLDSHPEILIYGKPCRQNRSVGFFSDTSIGYRYSGQVARSKPMTDSLNRLLAMVNSMFGAEFNGILINKYDGGEETIGKHSDEEKALDRQAGVVCISVGAVRKFRIRDKSTGKIVIDVPTIPGKILQMWGNFQKDFTHEIPTEKKVEGTRYSFTFRKHTE